MESNVTTEQLENHRPSTPVHLQEQAKEATNNLLPDKLKVAKSAKYSIYF